MEHKIVYVRLLTGEELITTHVNTDNETFSFQHTLQLFVGEPKAPKEPPALGFLPWLHYTKAMEKVAINKAAVVLMCDPIDQLKAEYQKITGKIITPPTGLILP